jgi:hypothetical protein
VLLCGLFAEIIDFEWVNFSCTVAQSKKHGFFEVYLLSQIPEAEPPPHGRRPVRGDPGPGVPGVLSTPAVEAMISWIPLFLPISIVRRRRVIFGKEQEGVWLRVAA